MVLRVKVPIVIHVWTFLLLHDWPGGSPGHAKQLRDTCIGYGGNSAIVSGVPIVGERRAEITEQGGDPEAGRAAGESDTEISRIVEKDRFCIHAQALTMAVLSALRAVERLLVEDHTNHIAARPAKARGRQFSLTIGAVIVTHVIEALVYTIASLRAVRGLQLGDLTPSVINSPPPRHSWTTSTSRRSTSPRWAAAT